MEKAALVTGSSSGIGLETALALARDGYHTFAGVRNMQGAERLKEAIRDEGIPAELVELDVNNAESVKAALKGAAEGKNLEVLVNNAGYGQFGCIEDVSMAEFRAQFETNFFSVVNMIQQTAPIMRRQKSGAIINISSVAGRMGLPGSPAYISSKFALEGLGECLRYELGMFGIRTTLIEPGVVRTSFFDSMRVPTSSADPKYAEVAGRIHEGLKMMVKMGTSPAEVARTVIRALHDEQMLPRYVVGTDAAMFMEAKGSKTDIEFERYMGAELFPG